MSDPSPEAMRPDWFERIKQMHEEDCEECQEGYSLVEHPPEVGPCLYALAVSKLAILLDEHDTAQTRIKELEARIAELEGGCYSDYHKYEQIPADPQIAKCARCSRERSIFEVNDD